MIKRIKEIVGVGPFENFDKGGQYQFESLTLIFGLNTYGKSTLADIFRSLRDNNIEIIKNRQTVGMNNQQIKIKYFSYENQREQDLLFNNDHWNNRNNFPFKIEVFDTKFIEKNVFTGLSITRDNRENLTDFILGEEGVNLANDIKDSKKKRDDLKTQVKIVKESVAEKIKDYSIELIDFINLNVDLKEKKNLEEEIRRLEHEISKINDNKNNTSSILKLKGPEVIEIDLNFSTLFTRINEILGKDYKELNQEILNKIIAHINSAFKEKDNNEEEWIGKGFSYVKGDINSVCPFCGQPLNQNELFSLYQKYFSDGYRNFWKETRENVNELERGINSKYKQLIDNILKIYEPVQRIENAKKYIDEEDFHQNAENLSSQINILKGILEKYKAELDKLQKDIQDKKAEKFKSPYNPVELIDILNILEIEKEARNLIKDINNYISVFSEWIENFKNTYQDISQLETHLNDLTKELKEKKVKLLRIKLNEECNSWKNLNEKRQQIIEDIEGKEGKLRETQEDFVNKFFEKVNELFESFGSNNFKIQKRIERRGHKNTVSLEIIYRGNPVSYDNLEFVFSDSDRRALAFSIFLARLENFQSSELEKTIVILDDPVVSFDDNRIRVTIFRIKELQRKTKQVIVFSHYNRFLQKLVGAIRDNYSLLKIEKLNSTSQLIRIEPSDFLLDEHEKMFLTIHNFIERRTTNLDPQNLRLFFENEIKIRYRMQLYQYNLTKRQLRGIIDGLSTNNIITEEVKNKIHNFREQLNPEHHSYIGRGDNDEDIRNFADELLKFLYKELR